MFQTLQYVNAALSRVSPTSSHREYRGAPPDLCQLSHHRLQPDLGTVPQTQLWEMATYEIKPRLNRLDGVSTVLVQGGRNRNFTSFPIPRRLLAANVTVTDILDSVRRTNLIDSPGLFERNHQLFLGLVNGQVESAADRRHRHQEHARRNSRARRGRRYGCAGRRARLYDRHGEWEAGGPAQHQPPARQQHGRRWRTKFTRRSARSASRSPWH